MAGRVICISRSLGAYRIREVKQYLAERGMRARN